MNIEQCEVWKDIPNYEGLYQISNLGNVKSLDKYVNVKPNGILSKRKIKGKLLKPYLHKSGYYFIKLCKNSISKSYKIHRLVAQTFILNPNNYECVNHKDENTLNNKIENLEWCTKKYNNNYGNRNKKISKSMCKEVNQYDLDGNFIKTWNSIKEAQKYYNIGNISNVCNGKRGSASGYIWKFKEEQI